jgi:glycosyltransferase involved in cell wall biosynthesis
MVGDLPLPGESAVGGVAAAVAAVAGPLARLVDLTIVVPGASQDREAMFDGVPVRYLAAARGPGVLRYWSLDAARVARDVAALDPDLVHIQGAAGLGLRLTVPTIVTVHGIAHLNARHKLLAAPLGWLAAPLVAGFVARIERYARRRAGNIVLLNQYVEEELPDIRGLRRVLIPNPVHPDFLGGYGTGASRGFRLLAVGRVEAAKGVRDAITLLAHLARMIPDVQLAFAGPCPDPSFLNECNEQITTLGVGDRIEFLGRCDRRRLIAEYDRSSCLVMLSRQETAPVVVSEALCRGLPVAAVDRFGLREMVRDGTNGVLLSSTVPESQAQALVSALVDGRLDRRAIAADAASRYAPEVVAAQLADFYRTILATAGRPSAA